MSLYERAVELARLDAGRQLAHESGRVITVIGAAGSGKTTLIRAGILGADTVLRGLCDPLATPRPLGPIREALGETGPSSGPGLGHHSGTAPNADGLSAIGQRLVAAISAEPTVLVIEDAQWIDAASIEVLRHLVRRIDGLPALLVLSYRDDAIPPGHRLLALLGDIARLETSETIRLSPLSEQAVADFLGEHAGAGSLNPAHVHALTGGNPFYVAEVARHPDEDLPHSVRDAVLASTTELAADDLEVLQMIAAAPDGLDDRLLPALGIDFPALTRVEATSLLARIRHSVAFRHELARLAIAESTPPAVRARFNARLLAAFESIESHDYAVLTHHAHAAGDRAATPRYAALAAEEAARSGAHTEAAAFLALALEHSSDPETRAGLLERLSTEQYMVSRLSDSVESIVAAVALRDRLGDPSGAAIAHDRRAIIEYYSARREVAEQHARLAATVSAGTATSPTAQTTLAYLAYRRHDLVTAREIGRRARDAADVAHDDVSQVRLDITEAASALVEGDLSARARLLASATVALDRSLDEVGTTALSNLSALDVEHRRLREAESVLSDSVPLTIELDIPICRQWQTGMRSRLHLMRGRWTAASEDAAAVLEEHGAPLAAIWPHLVLAQIGSRTGSAAREIEDHLDTAWELAQSLNESLVRLATLSAIAEHAWHTGASLSGADLRLADAAAALTAGIELPGTEWAVGDLAVWLRRLGNDETLVSSERLAAPHRRELDGQHGEAAAEWRELGLPFDAALAGIHGDDAALAEASLRALDDLGVEATVNRASAVMNARGFAAPPRSRRASTRANPSGLTNRQLDVARLVAQGYTNAELATRLYISPKTADHHVSAILTKLGLASRRDVIRRSEELGLGSGLDSGLDSG